MQEAVHSKRKGDIAFRRKDFSKAIEFYTQVCLSFAHLNPLQDRPPYLMICP